MAAVVTMTKIAKHVPSKLTSKDVHCECGWTYHLDHPDSWGNLAAKDYLLDRFNDHLKDRAEKA